MYGLLILAILILIFSGLYNYYRINKRYGINSKFIKSIKNDKNRKDNDV